MSEQPTPCASCGRLASATDTLPAFNGDIVADDFPFGPLVRLPACAECVKMHARGHLAVTEYSRRRCIALWAGGAGI